MNRSYYFQKIYLDDKGVSSTFTDSVLETIKNIKIRYPDMAGIDVWEYFESPPDKNDPSMWAKLVKEIITTHRVRKWFKLSWLFN